MRPFGALQHKISDPAGHLKFQNPSTMAENLTVLDLAEIENLLYKSRSLNMKQKELHQYLSQEKSLFSNTGRDLRVPENYSRVTTKTFFP